MLETSAIVVQVEGQLTLVKPDQSGCGPCKGKGCGASKLSQLFCRTPRQFQVENQINANVGDKVIISIGDGVVLKGVGLIYALPLLLLIVGAFLGDTFAVEQRDGYAAVGAAIGLGAGFIMIKLTLLRHGRNRYSPFIARKVTEE
ncbi:MAG: SoxR reducing system RseC family protein [Gallionella sp.]